MKVTNRWVSLLLLTLLLITGCTPAPVQDTTADTKEPLRISVSNAPGSLPFFILNSGMLDENLDIELTLHKTSEEVVAKMVKGDIDLALFGVQEAANLYNKDIPVRLVSVNNWADFEILSTDQSITSLGDLAGKTIWMGSKGGSIDLLMRVLLNDRGLLPGNEVTIQRMRTAELSQMASSGLKDIDTLLLREPFVSQVLSSNPQIHSVLHLGNAYEERFGHKVPQSGLVAHETALTDKGEQIDSLLMAMKESQIFIDENPERSSEIGSRALKEMEASTLMSIIEKTDFQVLDAPMAKDALELYYEQILAIEPATIEGAIPDESFYYTPQP